jgi:putative transposase
MPADFPPWSTVHDYLAGCQESGATAAVIDSQSVKAAEEVARASRGFDAAKKVNGRKRHIAVDVTGCCW